MESNESNTEINNSRKPPKRKVLIIVAIIISIIVVVMAGLAVVEMRTSYLQSRYLSVFAKKLSFSVMPGPNKSLTFPEDGPYDERLGYTQLPSFLKRLTEQGYQIETQARPSYSLNEVMQSGLFTTYREKTQAGLQIYSQDSQTLFDARFPQRIYNNFESIPPLITKSLLFIENRELLDPQNSSRNPAVEWDRLAKAMVDKGINIFNPGHHYAGGSTLATQIEKFRHSPEGRTADPHEKLKQMTSASLRAYLNGPDTTKVRRQLVVDYLNSVPLAAIPGYGEVNGIGDGLWTVYGTDFNTANQLLCDNCGLNDPRKAEVYKQVLSLFIAQRRPSFYLVTDRNALELLTNSYLRALCKAGFISASLRDSALQAKLSFRKGPPELPAVSFVGRKAANTIRRQLSYLLNVPQLYELDRLDLTVKSTLNNTIQDDISKLLLNLKDPQFIGEAGLRAFRLLEKGEPDRVIYSFTLYEHVGNTNLLRIQTDNFDQPFDINEGVKIELGSTAKLRTLVTYLEIIADLYERNKDLPPEKLRAVTVDRGDRLTQWVLEYLLTNKEASLQDILDAAMERRYSASPGETFFTGGGQHTFHNFEKSDNAKILSVRDGLRNSVNLVFIRLMRDIVRYYMYHVPGSTARILEDMENPARQVYLTRFADKEGRVFLNRFYSKYQDKKSDEQLDTLMQNMHPVPHRLASVYRFIKPEAGVSEFSAFLKSQIPSLSLSGDEIEKLYEKYGPDKWDLHDRGYIARIHPLELWLVAYLRAHPGAKKSDVMKASVNERQEVYTWLFKTHRKNAQDIRIKTLLEVEAFLEIHKAWKRLGYPFNSLVPSYATSIGSSADRPSALAELVGIIVNDGVLYPVSRVDELLFAAQTPYETKLKRKESEGQRILAPEITATLRSALINVAQNGSAKRIYGAFVRSDGSNIDVGGKTGTGDNRRESYAKNGQLIESRAINRAAVFVFFIGNHFYGTITAYVPGAEAANYNFTSSLPVQILKMMAPKLMPMIRNAEDNPAIPMIARKK